MLGIGIYRLMKKITFIHISDVLLGALPDRECVCLLYTSDAADE